MDIIETELLALDCDRNLARRSKKNVQPKTQAARHIGRHTRRATNGQCAGAKVERRQECALQKCGRDFGVGKALAPLADGLSE